MPTGWAREGMPERKPNKRALRLAEEREAARKAAEEEEARRRQEEEQHHFDAREEWQEAPEKIREQQAREEHERAVRELSMVNDAARGAAVPSALDEIGNTQRTPCCRGRCVIL